MVSIFPSRHAGPDTSDGPRNAPVPQSRFITYLGEPILSHANWDMIATHEPDKVVQWVLYLHQREDEHLTEMLIALSKALDYGLSRTEPWKEYAKTGVPHVLLDIIFEPDFLEDNNDSFKVCDWLFGCFVVILTFFRMYRGHFSYLERRTWRTCSLGTRCLSQLDQRISSRVRRRGAMHCRHPQKTRSILQNCMEKPRHSVNGHS